MSLSNSYANAIKKTRVYKLCRVTIFNSKNNKNNNNSYSSNIVNSSCQGTVYYGVGASAATPVLSPLFNQTSNSVPVEKRELFVPGFMEITNENNLRCISYSILKALLPSLNQSLSKIKCICFLKTFI